MSVSGSTNNFPIRAGLLTGYRSSVWLRRSVDRLLCGLPAGRVIALIEETPQATLAAAHPGVIPAWRAAGDDFLLASHLIQEHGLQLLHVNCCPPLAASEDFHLFLADQRRRGIKITAHLQDPGSFLDYLTFFAQYADAIVVDHQHEKLRLVASGLPSNKIWVIESGVGAIAAPNELTIRSNLGLSAAGRLISFVNFGSIEQNLEAVLLFVSLIVNTFPDVVFHLLQMTGKQESEGRDMESLSDFFRTRGLGGHVRVIEAPPGSARLEQHIAASDVVILGCSTLQYEMRELVGLCLEMNKAVVASPPLPFDTINKAVLIVNEHFSLAEGVVGLLANPSLAFFLKEHARSWAGSNGGEAAVGKLLQCWRSVFGMAGEELCTHSSAGAVEGEHAACATWADRLCSDAEMLCEQRKLEEAKERYHSVLAALPHFVRALRGLGTVTLIGGSPLAAEQYFRRALFYDACDLRALTGLGAVQWSMGNKEGAFQLYQQISRENPSDFLPVLSLVETGFELSRYAPVEQALRRFLLSNTNDVNARYYLAACYYRQHKVSLARRMLQQVLQAQPDHHDAQELLQTVEKELRVQHREMTASLTKMPVTLQESLRGREESAQAAPSGAADEIDAARQPAEAEWTPETGYDATLAGLGLWSMRQGSLEQAWQYFFDALEINIENHTALTHIMQLSYRLQHLPELAALLKTYLARHPGDRAIRYALAECLSACGNKLEAAEHCRMLLTLDPGNALARQLLEQTGV